MDSCVAVGHSLAFAISGLGLIMLLIVVGVVVEAFKGGK